MKIIFLCGSLEPGKDGVGDYTRLLAGKIQSYGHQVAIVSLSNKYIANADSSDNVLYQDGLTTFRFSSLLDNQNSFTSLKKILSDFKPDFISLQYVPYSFSAHGTPVFLGKKLKGLYSKCRWHIMVHEPFLSSRNKTLKKTLIRSLQIWSLRFLHRNLKPVVWHTSNRDYQRRLQQYISVNCKLLGLFGNIPVLPFHEEKEEKSEPKSFTAVYFGAVPQPGHQHFFADKLSECLKHQDFTIDILFCGNGGTDETAFHQLLINALPATQVSVRVLGKLPAEELSHVFSTADFGIARVFPHWIGKSGSAIAMLEHGLPLWLSLADSDNYRMDIDFRPELCFKNLADIHLYENKTKIPVKRLPIIAAAFLKDLVSDSNRNKHATVRVGG